MEELEHLDRGRRGADVDRDDLVETEMGAEPAEHALLHLGRGCGDLLRDLLAGLLEPGPSRSRPASPSGPAACCSSGRLSSMVSSPAFSFSQIRGTAKNQVGRTVGQERDDLARVRADRTCTPDHRQVVVSGALGDVSRRQPRDDLRSVLGELDQVVDARTSAEQVALGQLRRPSAAPSCRTCRSGSACRRAERSSAAASSSKSGSVAISSS